MKEELRERLKKLEIEEIIWMILIGILVLSFYANVVERKYLIHNDLKSREEYRNLQTFIFVVAFFIYLYYTTNSYKDILSLNHSDSKEKVKNTYLSFISSLFILIAGAILIYISTTDKEVEIELALN